MKNLILPVIVAIAMIACADRNAPVNPNSDKGALPGKFSISATQQVRFSQGNLQYRASKNKWRFAENQYDIVGANNANISDKYDGWIDLFGYGTGDNPTLCNPDDRFYSNYVEWGDNPVTNGGNKAKQWRTLRDKEWEYLLEERPNAHFLLGTAKVNDQPGLILLPDDWTTPAGIAFVSSAETAAGSGSADANIYSASQWSQMESAGAVFLPAAGARSGTYVGNVGTTGFYWSGWYADRGDGKVYVSCWQFSQSGVLKSIIRQNNGYSVRLVQ